MDSLRIRIIPLVIAVGVATLAACTETLENTRSCPVLCPGQDLPVRDTLVDAVMFDTTVGTYPPIGAELYIPLARRGDTLDVRGVVRFDSLPQRAVTKAGDTTTAPIALVDSARIVLRLSTPKVRPAAWTVEVYDVDTTAADPLTAGALFRPDKRLGVRDFATADSDSVSVPIDGAQLLAKIKAKARLRIGLRVTGTPTPLEVRLGTIESGTPAQLRFRASRDTALRALTVNVLSTTPDNDPFLRATLTDYAIVVAGPPPPDAQSLAIGGIPAWRSYLRFDVPSRIADSTTVVRATLLLTQRSNPRSPLSGDRMLIRPQVVLATPQVTDLYKAALQVDATPGFFGADTLSLVPIQASLVSIDMVRLLRRWRNVPLADAQRAIVVRAAEEGTGTPQSLFWSRRATDPAVRPRLRISYIPRVDFARP
ncbi:MAG: hypothetical protein NVS1B4_13920 [Gemmatimonadaceae bacterium]